MIIHQNWKDELVALVNKANSLTLKTTDVNFSIESRDPTTQAVTVRIDPDASGPYFNHQTATYVPRDIAKNFVGIPLRLIVQNDTTMRAMLTRIATRYGISLDEAIDFTSTDLDKAISFADSGIQDVELNVAGTSFVWVGKLQFTVANDTLSLETIIANVDLSHLRYMTSTQDRGSLEMVSLANTHEHPTETTARAFDGTVTKEHFVSLLASLVARNDIAQADADYIIQQESGDIVLFDMYDLSDPGLMKTALSYRTPNLEGALYAVGKYPDEVVPEGPDMSALTMMMGAGAVLVAVGDVDGAATINWGDGSPVETSVNVRTGNSHTYTGAGPYKCVVTPTNPESPDWKNNQTSYRFKISGPAVQEVVSWRMCDPTTKRAVQFACVNLTEVPDYWPGWTIADDIFNGCTKLVASKIGAWDVSMVTSLMAAFRSCAAFNTNLNDWDVSKVEEFSTTFLGCTVYNQPMNKWVLTSSWSTIAMFTNCKAFNQDISGWNMGSISSVSQMFMGASAFNQNLSGWNSANFTDVGSMFQNATAFDQDLSGWNVAKVTRSTNFATGSAMAATPAKLPAFTK